MYSLKSTFYALSIFGSLIVSPLVSAHVSIANKIYSNATNQIDISVPHGCEGFDTVKVEVTIPEGVTGTHPYDNVFGPASLETDEQGVVTKVIWTSNKETPYATDNHAYIFSLRAKTPDANFRTIYFPTIQTCKDSSGTFYTSEWVGMEAHDGAEHTETSGAEAAEPAPSAVLFPKVKPGWTKFIINEHLHDLSIFNDAEIVWMGSAAYSGNTQTMKLIVDDPDTSPLLEIHPESTIWVKY